MTQPDPIIDRLARAAGDRGWISYRNRHAHSGAISSAAFGPDLHIMQPACGVLIEPQEHEHLLRGEAGNDADLRGHP